MERPPMTPRAATARGIAEAERHFAAPMTAMPATASRARKSPQRSLERETCSYFGPVVNHSNRDVCIWPVATFCRMPSEMPRRGRIALQTRRCRIALAERSISGDGRGARLKNDAGGVQSDELGVGHQIQR